jgi:hypothetical protein
MYEKDEKFVQNLGRKTWREETTRRYRHRLDDNIRMALRVGRCGMDASGSG